MSGIQELLDFVEKNKIEHKDKRFGGTSLDRWYTEQAMFNMLTGMLDVNIYYLDHMPMWFVKINGDKNE